MYIGAIPTPAATESRQEFTATANQTVFSTTGGTVGFCDCYLNGVKMAASDFTFDGADVTLTSGAAAGDVLAVVMRQADNALVALPIKDSAGNNVLSEANNVVSIDSGVQFPAGHVIKTEMTSRISGSTQSSTDVSVATPSFTTTVANSKIYIMMTLLVNTTASGSNNFIYVKFYHGSTLLLDGFPIVGSFNATDVRGVAAWNYLYSPNVSAGTTLNFDLKINAYFATEVMIDASTNPSHITFMEIAP